MDDRAELFNSLVNCSLQLSADKEKYENLLLEEQQTCKLKLEAKDLQLAILSEHVATLENPGWFELNRPLLAWGSGAAGVAVSAVGALVLALDGDTTLGVVLIGGGTAAMSGGFVLATWK